MDRISGCHAGIRSKMGVSSNDEPLACLWPSSVTLGTPGQLRSNVRDKLPLASSGSKWRVGPREDFPPPASHKRRLPEGRQRATFRHGASRGRDRTVDCSRDSSPQRVRGVAPSCAHGRSEVWGMGRFGRLPEHGPGAQILVKWGLTERFSKKLGPGGMAQRDGSRCGAPGRPRSRKSESSGIPEITNMPGCR